MCKDCEEKKDYGKTLNLPKTDFPMRASLPENEPKIQARVFDQGLYDQVKNKYPNATVVASAKATLAHFGLCGLNLNPFPFSSLFREFFIK